MNMKKIISWGMMLAAAFTLTNCAKEIENPNEQPETAGVPFEIVASTVDTKTVNDGMHTNWAEGDQINLFHAVCNGTEYKNNGAFTVSDVEGGHFKGFLCEELDVVEEYDWYAVYPYNADLTSPKNTTAAFTIATGLVQDGYDNMKHLAGDVLPLYGKAIAVPGADMPALEMSQIASVIAVKVTNNTAEAIEVNKVSFVADGNYLAGSYCFDFSGEKLTLEPTEAVYTTATVSVENATSLAAGASATVYLPIMPFEAHVGDCLTLVINDEVTKEIILKKDVDFTSGKIKTLNFSYETEEEVPAFKDGAYWIVANDKYAMPLTGNYGYLQVDKAGYTDNVFTFKAVDGGYTIQQAGDKYLYMTGTYDSFNVSATIPSAGGHVWTIEQNEDGSYKILNVLKDKYIQLDSQYGTYGSYNAVKGTMPNLVPADDATIRPIFTVDSATSNVESTVTEASFKITSNQNWTVVPGEGVSVDVTAGSGNATVTLTFAENTSEEAVVYTATVKAAGFEDIVLTVTQSGVPTGDEPIGGGRDDFNTVATNTSYGTRTSTAGWKGTNCAVMQGGTSDNSPTFKFIGSTNSTRAFTMNGKTSAVGTITSPTLNGGCGTLTFNYGLPFIDTKIMFRVDIMQGGAVVKTFTINKTSASKLTKYSHEEAINVAGDFQIVFTNLSPSNSGSNKDRTAIWDVEWTGCN